MGGAVSAALADYTCLPSKKNEFATDKTLVKISANKVQITEVASSSNVGNKTGEARLEGAGKASRYVTFEHLIFSPLSDWFGEGYGQVLVGQDLIAGNAKGRLAIAWCYHWCSYDYFSCYKN